MLPGISWRLRALGTTFTRLSRAAGSRLSLEWRSTRLAISTTAAPTEQAIHNEIGWLMRKVSRILPIYSADTRSAMGRSMNSLPQYRELREERTVSLRWGAPAGGRDWDFWRPRCRRSPSCSCCRGCCCSGCLFRTRARERAPPAASARGEFVIRAMMLHRPPTSITCRTAPPIARCTRSRAGCPGGGYRVMSGNCRASAIPMRRVDVKILRVTTQPAHRVLGGDVRDGYGPGPTGTGGCR